MMVSDFYKMVSDFYGTVKRFIFKDKLGRRQGGIRPGLFLLNAAGSGALDP